MLSVTLPYWVYSSKSASLRSHRVLPCMKFDPISWFHPWNWHKSLPEILNPHPGGTWHKEQGQQMYDGATVRESFAILDFKPRLDRPWCSKPVVIFPVSSPRMPVQTWRHESQILLICMAGIIFNRQLGSVSKLKQNCSKMLQKTYFLKEKTLDRYKNWTI